LCGNISLWIARHISSWAHFRICGAIKYLGARIGPGAGIQLWGDAIAKWRDRALQISASRSSPAAAAAEYNARALPVLGYIAQFSPLPPSTWKIDADNARRMLGFTPNALEWRQYFGLGALGFPSVSSAGLYCWLSHIRVATKTITVWKSMRSLLELHCEGDVSLARLNRSLWWGPHWDASPYCENLFNASIGRHSVNEVTKATQARCITEPPLDQRSISKILRQSNCYACTDFGAVFRRRLVSTFPLLHDSPFEESELPTFFASLLKCKPYVQTCVLKTCFNAWTTSSRMHSEHVLPCLFGCKDEKDILSHYLRCPVLWAPIAAERCVETVLN